MVALITISFILSAFPLFMGCLSLPILFFQDFFSEKGLDKEEQLLQQGKIEAWFYGLWLPTIIWTIAFAVYKSWTYFFLENVSLIEPLDYFGGIFFVLFYLFFHWGYLAFRKNENLGKPYDATQVFKVVFSILLFFVLALLSSLCFLLFKSRS